MQKMKLEVAESLFYSWLRHVKGCHVVQTNWKPSPTWILRNENKIEKLKRVFVEHYAQDAVSVFGKTKNHSQLLKQAEVDVLGLSLSDGKVKVYAIDAAYHRGGLGYKDNIGKARQKILRMAMCVCGYFDGAEGEIIFASPKVNPAVWKELEPCEREIGKLLKNNGLNFAVRIIANEKFTEEVIVPVQAVAKEVNDMSELFLRSYQLLETCKKSPK